ncbi:hypothetical protein ACOSP7_016412 [Xanthoceras sorbifolium]
MESTSNVSLIEKIGGEVFSTGTDTPLFLATKSGCVGVEAWARGVGGVTTVTSVVVGAREIDGAVGRVAVVVCEVEIAGAVGRLAVGSGASACSVDEASMVAVEIVGEFAGVMVVVGTLTGTVVDVGASELDEFLPYIREIL